MLRIAFVPVCFGTKWSKFHLSPFALVQNGLNFICPHLLWYQMIKLPLEQFALVLEQMGANAICSSLVPNEH